MADDKVLTTEDKIAAIEARRVARKSELEVKRLEQYAKDLEALDDLEVEHGDGRVAKLELPAFIPGLPTIVIVRAPSEVEGRRFNQQLRNANGKAAKNGEAIDLLSTACVVYPEAEEYKAVKDAFPGIHACAGQKAVELYQAKMDAEGKS